MDYVEELKEAILIATGMLYSYVDLEFRYGGELYKVKYSSERLWFLQEQHSGWEGDSYDTIYSLLEDYDGDGEYKWYCGGTLISMTQLKSIMWIT